MTDAGNRYVGLLGRQNDCRRSVGNGGAVIKPQRSRDEFT